VAVVGDVAAAMPAVVAATAAISAVRVPAGCPLTVRIRSARIS
jgi:hypothetical protein